MLPLPVYYALLGLCWVYALRRGGEPERIGATVMVIGSVLTSATPTASAHQAGAVVLGILIIDVVAFIAFAVLALRADRFWPIWVAALAGLGVLGHLARWYGGPDVTPGAYVVSIVIWSYPILALIAIGTLNHQRRVVRCRAENRAETIAPRARS